jgi:hypothetical protein
MANLIVTFFEPIPTPKRAQYVPIPVGSSARTERIEVGAASAGGQIGALTAATGENGLRLEAEAECWVVVGSSPTVEAGQGWHLDADAVLELWVEEGEKVAVIEA